MRTDDCERKMVDCPYCGKAFSVPTIEQQLAAAEQREAVLRECVELYAAEKHWYGEGYLNCWKYTPNGFAIAKAALAKVEEIEQ